MSPAQQERSGFTVVEVMFVLAIVGIISVLVFLAIPTLQRNGRNTQRKQDVAAVFEAFTRYQMRNSGNVPSAAPPALSGCSGTSSTPAAGSPQSCESVFLQSVKLGYFDKANISVVPAAGAGGGEVSLATSDSDEVLKLYNYRRCKGAVGNATAAGYFDVVALYRLEQRDGYKDYCQQL